MAYLHVGGDGLRLTDAVLGGLLAFLLTPAVTIARDWPQWCGSAGRNAVSDARHLPVDFEPAPRKSVGPPQSLRGVKWCAPLGSQTYGSPVIAGGKVFVGTNNDPPRDPRFKGDRSALLCLDQSTGERLWELNVPKLPPQKKEDQWNGDYPKMGISSPPAVEGERLYIVTNRCEVLCLDVNGMADGNNGPYRDEATYLAEPAHHRIRRGSDGPHITFRPGKPLELKPTDGDIIWRFDMMDRTRVWPQDACNSAPLIVGDYIIAGTSNGVDLSHRRVPSPDAPSLVVLKKHTGQLVAVDDAGIGPNILHGGWSSPSLGTVNGRQLVFYGGADGICYAFDPRIRPAAKPGEPGTLPTVWSFDANPQDYRYDEEGRELPYNNRKARGTGPSEIISTPVFVKGKVYVAIGQDPRHGKGRGAVSCIDPAGRGHITERGKVWQFTDIGWCLGSPVIHDGLLYIADLPGTLYCLDAATGELVWKHENMSDVWATPLVADGKVYLGTGRRGLYVFAAGREKRLLSHVRVTRPIYASPAVADNTLFIPSHTHLFALPGRTRSR